MKKIDQTFTIKTVGWGLILILVLIAAIAQGFNMFNFPAYFDDEGTYMSQAWAFMTQGQLSHYTYWYDHPPVGWIQVGLWSSITKGFYAFGSAINSGRALMLVLGVLSVVLVYRIARHLGCNRYASFIGAALYALSPLALTLRRMVFLDNFLVFWLLLSIALIVHKEKRLKYIILSALAFSIALLSKEIGIVFLPAMVYLISFESHNYHRRFALAKWLTIVALVASFWILYALLKGELFPTGSFLGGEAEHVSLIETIQYQLSRAGDGNMFTYPSDFWSTVGKWITGKYALLVGGVEDKMLIVGGVLSLLLFNLIRAVRDKYARFVVLTTLLFVLFLGRGGLVLEFYIIPLLPFLALNIALAFDTITSTLARISKKRILTASINVFLVIAIISGYVMSNRHQLLTLFISKPVFAQTEALDWVAENIDKDVFILTDDYAYLDLRQRGFEAPNPIYYWKAERDPNIRQEVLQNDWRNIKYIVVTPLVERDIKRLPFIYEAYKHSIPIKSFTKSGYTVTIARVHDIQQSLINSWDWYKLRFIDKQGKTKEPHALNRTTSEAQSYAMLKAVWMNDKETFNRVLGWSMSNIKLEDKSLFAWWYGIRQDNSWGVIDYGTATDSDQDIALALLFAYKQWGNQLYFNLAKNIINDIWEYETVEINNQRYVVAGDWATRKENKIYAVNPSYLSPYAYRIFAQVDQEHDWTGVVDSTYKILQECTSLSFGDKISVNIPPDWCGISKDGEFVPLNRPSNYSYDALRVLWRVALDYQWYKDLRALDYLSQMSFWENEWKERQKIYAAYSHDGRVIDFSESLAQYGAQIALFSVTNQTIAEQVYKEKILSQLYEGSDTTYWGKKDDYYDQNWVWFGTALYSESLPNLWK